MILYLSYARVTKFTCPLQNASSLNWRASDTRLCLSLSLKAREGACGLSLFLAALAVEEWRQVWLDDILVHPRRDRGSGEHRAVLGDGAA